MHSQASVAAVVAAFQQGDLVRARQLAEKQLGKAEQPPLLQHVMGLIECRAGRMEAGADWLRRASDAEPGNIGFRVMLVRALIDSDRAAEALALAPPPPGSTPAELALWLARAEAADKAGDAEASLQAWLTVASAHRSDWRAWSNAAHAAARLERWADAATALARATALNPNDAAIANALGTALSNMGRFQEALAIFKRLAALDPANLQVRLTCARLLRDMGQYRDAMVEIEEGSRLALEQALANAGQGATGKAGRDAIRISPDHVAEVRELGMFLDRSSQHDGLRRLLAAAERAGIAPEALGYLQASVALREGRPEDAKRLLLHDRPDPDDGRWHRMMTRIADALGDSEEAFAAAGEMNRAVPDYDEWRRRTADYRAQIRAIAQAVTPDWASRIDPLEPDDSLPAAAFLVGFPRSGTTLLDTFLMGHPQTCVVEEGKMLEDSAKVLGDPPQEWPRDVLKSARKAYFDELARHVQPNFAGLVIDKHPLNMLRLAMIHALFPSAKVIFAQRHPCDVVLSGYLQGFELNHAMACFLDLADAADFYDAAMTLWTRSRDAFPQAIQPVVYERLILDPSAELRPAVQFLGLDWSDDVLDHEATAKSRGAITTPSYDQVVQPLSRAPSGRWRRYEKQLEPVLPVLLPWAERLGYAD